MMIFLGIAAVWISCAVLVYGIVFADMQRRFPRIANETRRSDQGLATLAASVTLLTGPFGLLLAMCMSGLVEHGLKYR